MRRHNGLQSDTQPRGLSATLVGRIKNRMSMIENQENGTNLCIDDKLRGNVDAVDYKHVARGLIILKYIPDVFLEKRADLEVKTADAKNEWHVKEPEAHYKVQEVRDGNCSGGIKLLNP